MAAIKNWPTGVSENLETGQKNFDRKTTFLLRPLHARFSPSNALYLILTILKCLRKMIRRQYRLQRVSHYYSSSREPRAENSALSPKHHQVFVSSTNDLLSKPTTSAEDPGPVQVADSNNEPCARSSSRSFQVDDSHDDDLEERTTKRPRGRPPKGWIPHITPHLSQH